MLYSDARADKPGYVDFAAQQAAYEKAKGDKPAFVGFDRRFAAWCETHPRATVASRDAEVSSGHDH